MNRTRYLLKNTAILAVGSFATKMIAFFLVPLYTKLLTTSEYGTIDLLYTIGTVLAPILILNISEAILRFSLDEGADHERILSIGIVLYSAAAVLGLLTIPVSRLMGSIADYSVYIYLYTITQAGTSVFLSFLRGKELLLPYSIGNILHSFSLAGFNLLFLAVFHWGIRGYFRAYILSGIVTILYAVIVGGVIPSLSRFHFDAQLAKEMARYSVVLIPNTFMWWIINSSDRIMVTSMLGAAANGIYAISYKLPTLVHTFSLIFNQAWGYSAIREENSQDKEAYHNVVYRGLFMSTLLCGSGLLFVLKPFLHFYVEQSYFEAWRYSPLLILSYIFMALGNFIATPYYVHKNSRGYLYSAAFGAALNLSLNLLLIPRIGIFGAAFATCVSYIGIFLYRILDTRKYLHIHVGVPRHILSLLLLCLMSATLFLPSAWTQLLLFVELMVQLFLFSPDWSGFLRETTKKLHRKRSL